MKKLNVDPLEMLEQLKQPAQQHWSEIIRHAICPHAICRLYHQMPHRICLLRHMRGYPIKYWSMISYEVIEIYISINDLFFFVQLVFNFMKVISCMFLI